MVSKPLAPEFAPLLARIGAPLLVIASVTSHFGVPVGAASTIVAAMLAAAVVTVLNHLVLPPLFAGLKMPLHSNAGLLGAGAVNATVGLFCALLTLPS